MGRWFNNLKLRSKLTLIFLVMIGLTIAVSAIALLTQSYAQQGISDVVNVATRKDVLALDIEAALGAAHQAENSYLLRYKQEGFEQARATYGGQLQSAVDLIHQHLAGLRELEDDPVQLAHLDEIARTVDEYERLFLAMVQRIEQRGFVDEGVEGQLRQRIREVEAAVAAANLPQLTIDVLTIRRSEKDYLLRGDQEYVTQNREGVATLKRDIAASSLSAERKDELRLLTDEYAALFEQLVQSDAAVAASAESYRAEVAKLGPIVDQLRQDADKKLAATEASLAETNLLASTLVIGISIMAVLLGLVIAFLLARSLSRSVATLAEAARGIAEGDLDQRVEAQSDDEFGQMMRSFQQMVLYLQTISASANRIADGDLSADVEPQSSRDVLGHAFSQMIANLRDLVGQIAESANNVDQASQQMALATDQAAQATAQVSATIQQVARGTAQQTEFVIRTSTSVDQMARAIDSVAKGAQEQAAAAGHSSTVTTQLSGAITQVAANAQASASGVTQAAQTARASAKTIEETIRGIESINEKVTLSSQKVKEMGQRSEEIGGIIETIDDIASQTDLLALNAAIEAARAGEYGKGFAVVADEVRKLAEKSAGATKEIAALIKGIQRTVSEAVLAMDEGAGEVKLGVKRASEAGQALAEIVVATETANRQMDEIALAAREMDLLAPKLVGAMDTVSAVIEENTAATEEMAASSGEVTQALENIASISEENSAAAEEVAASVEEVNAQVDEVTISARALSEMAETLQAVVTRFVLPAAEADERSFRSSDRNGHARGYANGHARGHANGHANGVGGKQAGRPQLQTLARRRD